MIDVALPRPRDRAVAMSEEFVALRERVWSLVMSQDADQTR